jgi:hypothetical protein
MVLMKAVLFNVTSAVSAPQGRGAEGLPNNGRPSGAMPADTIDLSLDDLDQARAREIEGKALTGILILLLKWFKVSRKSMQHPNSGLYVTDHNSSSKMSSNSSI